MKLLKLEASNFQSYPQLVFDYSDLGLTLISGQTKVGKSTLLDAPCWVLYGTTSKESAADDVKSWFSDGEPTIGVLDVETADGVISIVRKRGKASQNDLYWCEAGQTEAIRGKDITDTQRLLEERLGASAELYLNGSYIHQFSKADTIFTANAKDRRKIFERVADLSLPIKVGEQTSEARKVAKAELATTETEKARVEGKLEQILEDIQSTKRISATWDEIKKSKLDKLAQLHANFETEKNARVEDIVCKLEELDKIIQPDTSFIERRKQVEKQVHKLNELAENLKELDKKFYVMDAHYRTSSKELKRLGAELDVCPTCFGPFHNDNSAHTQSKLKEQLDTLNMDLTYLNKERETLKTALEALPKLYTASADVAQQQANNQRLLDKFESLRAQALVIREEKNHYEEQIAKASAEQNLHLASLDSKQKTKKQFESTQVKLIEHYSELEARVNNLTWLYDKSYELRGALLDQAIKQINNNTNEYLEKFFDAECLDAQNYSRFFNIAEKDVRSLIEP